VVGDQRPVASDLAQALFSMSCSRAMTSN